MTEPVYTAEQARSLLDEINTVIDSNVLARPCDDCGAPAFQPCYPSCTGLAAQTDEDDDLFLEIANEAREGR